MTHIEDVGDRLAQHEGSIASMERELERQRSALEALRDTLEGGETMAGQRRRRRRAGDPADEFQDQIRDNVRALVEAGGFRPEAPTTPIRPKAGQLRATASTGDEVMLPDLPLVVDRVYVDGVEAPITVHEDDQVAFQVPHEASDGEVIVHAGGRIFMFKLTLDTRAGTRKR